MFLLVTRMRARFRRITQFCKLAGISENLASLQGYLKDIFSHKVEKRQNKHSSRSIEKFAKRILFEPDCRLQSITVTDTESVLEKFMYLNQSKTFKVTDVVARWRTIELGTNLLTQKLILESLSVELALPGPR